LIVVSGRLADTREFKDLTCPSNVTDAFEFWSLRTFAVNAFLEAGAVTKFLPVANKSLKIYPFALKIILNVS
jgi:hypothetical protein